MVAADAVAAQRAARRRGRRRSPSGSRESSRTGAGSVPSAMPSTTTRSRSRPDGEGQGPDEHALAEPAHAPEVGVELDLERAAERRRAAAASSMPSSDGQALERGVDLLGGPHLVGRPVAAAARRRR